ncbi:MAG: hypothetical protein ACRC3Y_17300 [Romboutsia sp.]|uniref:hypothetical protein n=1 Tax=Romboutsia sp. TaxID=1965302 RepID=UPI003F335928
MNINENITSNILEAIKNNTTDCNENFKILHVYYDVQIPVDILKNEYENVSITNYKIDNPYTDDLHCDEKFDYIIFNEVIEKLVDYNAFLNNLKNYLEYDGKIICGIQNIMNRNVLKNILNGKFTYCDSGILNKSNLRFFTLDEIRRLFNKEKYDLNNIIAIMENPTKEEEEFITDLCSITNEVLKINFTANSFVINASKKINKTLFDYVLNP